MAARELILSALRQSCQQSPAAAFNYERDAFAERITGSPLEHFIAVSGKEGMSVECLTTWQDVPAAVSRYLDRQGLPARVVVDKGANTTVAAMLAAGLTASAPPLRPDHDALVSGCFAAVAESGALVLSTGDGHAIAHDFLAETHIVLLLAGSVVASMADLWDRFRADAQNEFMPREFCLVTGPSRTADLGVPAKLGAHGPARVHVLVIDEQQMLNR